MNYVVVILAGGMGTRIRHILPNLPKPLAPVFGRPFLEWVIRFLMKQGLNKIILSTGFLAEKIESFSEKINGSSLTLQCVGESSPLGTAGGVLNALDGYPNAFDAALVINGDSVVLADLTSFLDVLKDQSIDAAIMGVRVMNTKRYGTLKVNESGFLMGFQEKTSGVGLINAGMYLLRKKVLDSLPREKLLSFEMDVFPKLLLEKLTIKVIECDAPFIDIGTEDSLREADQFIQSHLAQF